MSIRIQRLKIVSVNLTIISLDVPAPGAVSPPTPLPLDVGFFLPVNTTGTGRDRAAKSMKLGAVRRAFQNSGELTLATVPSSMTCEAVNVGRGATCIGGRGWGFRTRNLEMIENEFPYFTTRLGLTEKNAQLIDWRKNRAVVVRIPYRHPEIIIDQTLSIVANRSSKSKATGNTWPRFRSAPNPRPSRQPCSKAFFRSSLFVNVVVVGFVAFEFFAFVSIVVDSISIQGIFSG
uniref:Uncharacterized protein n=1 Tax=Romanomermis culicivorax TaxID=13658 RepID=A0A915JU80_ROMCU